MEATKITYSADAISIGEVKYGALFWCDSNVYMRVQEPKDEKDVMAVDIDDGEVVTFRPIAEVVPVTVHAFEIEIHTTDD